MDRKRPRPRLLTLYDLNEIHDHMPDDQRSGPYWDLLCTAMAASVQVEFLNRRLGSVFPRLRAGVIRDHRLPYRDGDPFDGQVLDDCRHEPETECKTPDDAWHALID